MIGYIFFFFCRLRSHKLSQASETSEEPSLVFSTNAIPGPSNIEPNSSSV